MSMRNLRRLFLLLILSLSFAMAYSQTNYEIKIEKLAQEVAAAFTDTLKIRIGFGSITFNEAQTKFTELLYNDLSSELAALNTNQSKITLVTNTRLIKADGYETALSETDKALLLGREKSIDFLILGKLNENETGYKIQLKVLETKEGNLINAFKGFIDKSSEFETLNTQSLEAKPEDVVRQKPSEPVVQNITPVTQTNSSPPPPKEKKPKRENKFLKALGDMAISSLSSTVTKVVENKISPQSGSSSSQDPGATQNNSQSQTGTTDNNTNPGVDNTSSSSGSSSGSFCRAYINLNNKTVNTISISVYTENPTRSFGMTPIFTYTIAAGKSKKQKIDKDILYYYTATNSTGAPVVGGYREYTGTFQVEKCDETANEDIE